MGKFLEALAIECHYFFRININTTVPATPRLLYLFCLFIRIIVVAPVAFIVFITSVVAAVLLVIVIVYSCLLCRIGLQMIECSVVDISILIKLALALVIGLNTNNLATEKGSSRKLLYKSKSDVANGYECIGIIISILVLAPFFSISIFE